MAADRDPKTIVDVLIAAATATPEWKAAVGGGDSLPRLIAQALRVGLDGAAASVLLFAPLRSAREKEWRQALGVDAPVEEEKRIAYVARMHEEWERRGAALLEAQSDRDTLRDHADALQAGRDAALGRLRATRTATHALLDAMGVEDIALPEEGASAPPEGAPDVVEPAPVTVAESAEPAWRRALAGDYTAFRERKSR